MGWLPFGNRLVLLPKGLPFDDGDEVLREHRDVSGGWLRPAVFGAMDGLVTNSSLIAGIGGGRGRPRRDRADRHRWLDSGRVLHGDRGVHLGDVAERTDSGGG